MAQEKENLESFCFIQILLGSKCAAAVWQGIHTKLVALLQYDAKSPSKSSQGHRSFAVNLSEIGVGVEYKCYTHGSGAEVAL